MSIRDTTTLKLAISLTILAHFLTANVFAESTAIEVAYLTHATGEIYKLNNTGEWVNISTDLAKATPIVTDPFTESREVAIAINRANTLRTGKSCFATVKSTDGSIIELPPLTSMTFGSKEVGKEKSNTLIEGFFYFFSRREVDDREYSTDIVTAAIKGTEFVMSKDPSGTVHIHLIEGAIDLESSNHSAQMRSQRPGGPPPDSNVALIQPDGTIKLTGDVRFGSATDWFAYFPQTLILADLFTTQSTVPELAASIRSYETGNYKQAASFLATPQGSSTEEALYRAALALSIGDTRQASGLLESTGTDFPELTSALKEFMSAILGNSPRAYSATPKSPTAMIARSYTRQREGKLTAALAAIEQAERLSKRPSAIILVRKAKLLFALGRYSEANAAVESALNVSPHNTAAQTTRGFLALVSGKSNEAAKTFASSINQDPGSPEAFIGQALSELRTKSIDLAQNRLERAVALSPHHASYRAYLARVFMEQARTDKAAIELGIAQELTPDDPNLYLVQALLSASQSQLASATKQARASLTSTRQDSVQRSSAYNPTDAALRQANLAQLYADAGLDRFAIRHASSALVNSPSNPNAHKNLAQAYQSLLDPSTNSLRYQSPAQSEQLQYELFSPARAGFLALATTPNNYYNLLSTPVDSKTVHFRGLFDYGLSSGIQFLRTKENYSFKLNVTWDYLDELGENWNFDRRSIEAGYKIDLSADTTLTALARDVSRRLDNPSFSSTNKTLDSDESFPTLVVGLRHRWSPSSETAGYLQYLSHEANTLSSGSAFATSPNGDTILALLDGKIAASTSSDTLQVEIQHTIRVGDHSLQTGIRAQDGDWTTAFSLSESTTLSNLGYVELNLNEDHSFDRIEAYFYDTVSLSPNLNFVLGANLSSLHYPQNVFTLPPASGDTSTSPFLPKLGLSWKMDTNWNFRAAYSETLGGLALEDGYRLEPTQVAGFLQGYRSLLAETLDGSHPAVRFKQAGAGVTYQNDNNLLVDFELQNRSSASNRGIGRLYFDDSILSAAWASSTDFDELSAQLNVSTFLNEGTSIAFDYRYSDASIESSIPDVHASANRNGLLHAFALSIHGQNKRGYFAEATFSLLEQEREERSYSNDTLIGQPIDEQLEAIPIDFELGWRRPSGGLRIAIGVKNLGNKNTAIDPVNWTQPIYPKRAVYLDASMSF